MAEVGRVTVPCLQTVGWVPAETLITAWGQAVDRPPPLPMEHLFQVDRGVAQGEGAQRYWTSNHRRHLQEEGGADRVTMEAMDLLVS